MTLSAILAPITPSAIPMQVDHADKMTSTNPQQNTRRKRQALNDADHVALRTSLDDLARETEVHAC